MLPAALIFDVDGTLAETEETHRESFNAAFAEAGLDWRWDAALYRRLLDVTGGKERMRHYAETTDAALDDEAIVALHRRKTALYNQTVDAGGLALRPGIARLIAEARAAGVPMAIATTTSLPNIESLLRATLGPDAIGWFAAIAAGDMVRAKKPAPDVYRLALERLGTEPARSVAFEDSENGLRSALAAGLPTIVTVSGYTDDQDFPGALAVLTHLGDPGQPARVLSGPPLDRDVVELATVSAWLSDARGGSATQSPRPPASSAAC